MTEEENYGEQTAEQMGRELLQMFDRLDASAKNILNQRRADRERVASQLVKKETLEHQELVKLLAKPAPMETAGPDYF